MARKSEGYRARRLAARRSQRWGAYQNLALYALAAVVAFGAVLGAVHVAHDLRHHHASPGSGSYLAPRHGRRRRVGDTTDGGAAGAQRQPRRRRLSSRSLGPAAHRARRPVHHGQRRARRGSAHAVSRAPRARAAQLQARSDVCRPAAAQRRRRPVGHHHHALQPAGGRHRPSLQRPLLAAGEPAACRARRPRQGRRPTRRTPRTRSCRRRCRPPRWCRRQAAVGHDQDDRRPAEGHRRGRRPRPAWRPWSRGG